MKRKVLMTIFAVSIALAGCSGGKDTQPDGGISSGPAEAPAEPSEPEPAEEPAETGEEEPEEEELPLSCLEEHGLEFCIPAEK